MLTPRERRALQGRAEGERVWETARTMGLYFTGEGFR
jgi:hypothetical protein